MRRLIHLFALTCIAAPALATPATADAQDAAAGKTVFSSACSVCHGVAAGVNKIGPSLAGIYGRAAGSLPGYSYSEAMKNANRTWDKTTLTAYLEHPKQAVPGTKMAYPGQHDPEKLASLIAYLETLKQ